MCRWRVESTPIPVTRGVRSHEDGSGVEVLSNDMIDTSAVAEPLVDAGSG